MLGGWRHVLQELRAGALHSDSIPGGFLEWGMLPTRTLKEE